MRTGGGLVYVAYAIQLGVMWMGIIIVSSWNTLMVTLMANAIIGLQQLNGQLQQPRAHHDEDTGAQSTKQRRLSADMRMYAHLCGCVEKLHRVRSTVKQLEALMRPFIFLDFIVFSVLLCALLFQASRVSVLEVQVVSFFALPYNAHSR